MYNLKYDIVLYCMITTQLATSASKTGWWLLNSQPDSQNLKHQPR